MVASLGGGSVVVAVGRGHGRSVAAAAPQSLRASPLGAGGGRRGIAAASPVVALGLLVGFGGRRLRLLRSQPCSLSRGGCFGSARGCVARWLAPDPPVAWGSGARRTLRGVALGGFPCSRSGFCDGLSAKHCNDGRQPQPALAGTLAVAPRGRRVAGAGAALLGRTLFRVVAVHAAPGRGLAILFPSAGRRPPRCACLGRRRLCAPRILAGRSAASGSIHPAGVARGDGVATSRPQRAALAGSSRCRRGSRGLTHCHPTRTALVGSPAGISFQRCRL